MAQTKDSAHSLISSPEHLELARYVKDMPLKAIAEQTELDGQKLDGGPVAEKLDRLITQVWNVGGTPPQAPEALYAETLSGLDEVQRKALLEGYARLGHIYEITGLWARQHYFDSQPATPAGPASTVIGLGDDAAAAVQMLNRPEFEITLTQHATSTNGLASAKAQRAIGEAIRKKDRDALQEAVTNYINTPLLHRNAKGEEVSLNVRDETAIVLQSLGNIYDDLPGVYKGFDDPLKEKYGSAYKTQDLKLKVTFGSWGSAGDKDGNNNIFAESTLEAVAMHKLAIQEKYLADIIELEKTMAQSPSGETLARWKAELESNTAALGAILKDMRGTLGEGMHLTPEQMDDYVRDIRAIAPNKDAFVADLERAYEDQPEEGLLNLLRRARMFGFTFGKIEYRETAEEYERVTALLIPGYREMSDRDKCKKLEEVLADENAVNTLAEKARDEFSAGAGKRYDSGVSAESVLPIAYHTFKRMELARDFPEMIQDNVLAECQGAHNLLEAKLMQRLAKADDGREPHLGIVPLFESPETMEKVVDIMRHAYKSPIYFQHLREVADTRGMEPTQQIQLAHSDNARRTGALGARGYIHFAHKALYDLHEKEFGEGENKIGLRFFEGGSISDAYRNGVRAISGCVDDFQLYDFAKFTFQGGDLLNYFNQSTSIHRLLSRALSHQAKRLMQKDGTWQGNGNDKLPVSNSVADAVAMEALKQTRTEYEGKDFSANGNPMGAVMALLDYAGEQIAGQRGSRVGMRGKQASGNNGLEPVQVDKMRTIPFSEAWQHNGVVPIWIGGDDLQARHLYIAIASQVVKLEKKEEGKRSEEEKAFMNAFSDITEKGLYPHHVRSLYQLSRSFRDAMDRAAYGIALTDTDTFEWLRQAVQHKEGDSRTTQHTKNIAKPYVERLIETFRKVAPLTDAAQRKTTPNWSFEERIGKTNPEKLDELEDLRHSTHQTLEHMNSQILVKRAYRDFLSHVRHTLPEQRQNPDYWHLRAVLHNAGDTVVHGRVLPADDPAYGKRLMEDMERQAGLQAAM